MSFKCFPPHSWLPLLFQKEPPEPAWLFRNTERWASWDGSQTPRSTFLLIGTLSRAFVFWDEQLPSRSNVWAYGYPLFK